MRCFRRCCAAALLLACLPAFADPALTTLYTFSAYVAATKTNSDGASPVMLVQDAAGNLYGIASAGGTSGNGTVFELAPSGVLTVLHQFGPLDTTTQGQTNADGAVPTSLVIDPSGNLYGTTAYGGSGGGGTVFQLSQGVFTTIHAFDAPGDGWQPDALTLGTDGNLYGVTSRGGVTLGLVGSGTVFRVSTTGGFTVIYTFSLLGQGDPYSTENGDGGNPVSIAWDAPGNLYGATLSGGLNGTGTVFLLTPSGVLTTLHAFGSCPSCSISVIGVNTYGLAGYVNADGALSNPVLLARDGNLYGTTSLGGASGAGTFFRVTPTGSFSALYSFAGQPGQVVPRGPLVEGADGQFFGTSGGVLFSVDTNGKLAPLYSLPAGSSASGFVSLTPAASDPQGKFYVLGSTSKDSQPNGAIMLLTLGSAAAPTFSPVAGTYHSTQSVSLSTTTPDATIYYTIDGSTPTTQSAVYSGPIRVAANSTLQAMAAGAGYGASPVSDAAYTIAPGSSGGGGALGGWELLGLGLLAAWRLLRGLEERA